MFTTRRYTLAQRTGFGSFRPIACWRLNLDDYVLNHDDGSSAGAGAKKRTVGFAASLGGAGMTPEEEYGNLDLQGEHEHMLYPYACDEDGSYFLGPENVYHVMPDGNRRKLNVLIGSGLYFSCFGREALGRTSLVHTCVFDRIATHCWFAGA